MKTKLKLYRQGDVLIERIAEIPGAATPQQPARRIILAHGEVTGHHHALETEDEADWWKRGEGIAEEQFVRITAPAVVTHQEHATIELPAGKYRVIKQREYSPEEIRNVAD